MKLPVLFNYTNPAQSPGFQTKRNVSYETFRFVQLRESCTIGQSETNGKQPNSKEKRPPGSSWVLQAPWPLLASKQKGNSLTRLPYVDACLSDGAVGSVQAADQLVQSSHWHSDSRRVRWLLWLWPEPDWNLRLTWGTLEQFWLGPAGEHRKPL